MLGKMQDWPLRLMRLLDHAEQVHGLREIVTCEADGSVSRTNWKEVARDSRIFAHYLETVGIKPGDRVAILARNHARQLISWFGTMGMGGIVHTINWRLFDEQISYIINHAEDRVLLYDESFAEIVERMRPQLGTVERFICFDDEFAAIMAYESCDYRWYEGDEREPAMLCYTSGTTGNPKGVLYEHRTEMLHTLAAMGPDAFNLARNCASLSFVPMFHAASWGLPFGSAMTGARLIFSVPGDVPTMHRMIVQENVTHSSGVPTVWTGMLQYIDAHGLDLGKLRHISVGGSAASRTLIGRFLDMGINIQHLWGMTELSPVGTICGYPDDWDTLDRETKIDYIRMQGVAPLGIEHRLIDDEGNALPHDGKAAGQLQIRGAWVVDTYFRMEHSALDAEGWFSTGDIAVIHPNGYMQITDRAKDVIKSGGEWISSIELENAAVGCPGVAHAAAVGVPHPKWDERPILLVVRSPGAGVGEKVVRDHLSKHVANWWLPDEILFVDSLPLTGTGKVMKAELREQYKGYKLASLHGAG